MMIRLRAPSSTTVIACLALFLALGGSGYIAFAHGGASAAKKKKKVKVGPQGPAGPAGKNGATVVHIRTGTGTGTASADCNPGETPTGGGAIDNTAGGALKSSFPNAALDPTLPNGTWTAQAVAGTDSVTVRILCASP